MLASVRPGAAERRLHIPSRNVHMRRVVNEAALMAVGFEVFDHAEHSVRDQAHAFRDAEIVVVPEGYDQGVTSHRSLPDLFGPPRTQLFAREAAPDRKGNRCNVDIKLDVAELVTMRKAAPGGWNGSGGDRTLGREIKSPVLYP